MTNEHPANQPDSADFAVDGELETTAPETAHEELADASAPPMTAIAEGIANFAPESCSEPLGLAL